MAQQENQQTKQVTTAEYLNQIQEALMKQIAEKVGAMPEGFNKDRFILNCITLIRDMLKDKKKRENLNGISADSIALCMIKGAFLGLDFLSGECYAIPYGGEMNFQTDYKGEIKVCKKHSIQPIKDIFAKVVREGDLYDEGVEDGKQKLVFKPLPFNNGKMIGAFAIVTYTDGSMMYESMSADEIEGVRQNYSKAKDSDAWKKSSGEMYRKTVIRRLSKYIEKDFDKVEQLMAYDEGGGVEFQNGLLSTSRQKAAALPEKVEPVDAFASVKKNSNQIGGLVLEEVE
ncbi:MAG: recombinase RecT [Butyrivibrio sp.]|nr:recombinase RecT [Butyrivibrio sp.]